MAGQAKKVAVLRNFSRSGYNLLRHSGCVADIFPDLLTNSQVIPDPITKLHGDTEAMVRPSENSGSSQKRI